MARQRQAERIPIALNGIVETAVELLSFQLRAADIRIELDLDAELPKIVADPDQIHQVLSNLIDNARQALMSVDFTPRHSHCDACRPAGRQGRNHDFRQWPRCAPEHPRAHLRAVLHHEIRRRRHRDRAVALFEHRSLACRRDCGLRPAGGGTTFTVRLPLHHIAPGERAEALNRRAPEGLRVLIIEDEPQILDTLREILIRQGHRVDTAADGWRGLEMALKHDYNVVLSDFGCQISTASAFTRPCNESVRR